MINNIASTAGSPGQIRTTSGYYTRDEALQLMQALEPDVTVPKWELKAVLRHAKKRSTTFIQEAPLSLPLTIFTGLTKTTNATTTGSKDSYVQFGVQLNERNQNTKTAKITSMSFSKW